VRLLNNQSGFTLLEVIIALSIMVLALASILMVESNSLSATTRARQMNVVTMLARNTMTELEYKVEGKTFDEARKEESGTFPAPHQDYRWKTEIKEIKFPTLSMGGGGGAGGGSGGSSGSSSDPNEAGTSQIADMISKAVSNHFSKATREMTVTIYWKRGTTEVNYSVSTYWVDLNHEFEPQPQ
jgi:general secretion pathway protein I